MSKLKFSLLLAFSLFFTGCSAKDNIADESQCLYDFVNFQKDVSEVANTFILDDPDFETNITISKRQTNIDQKEDIVYCNIDVSNEFATHSYECILEYNLYNDGNWILDEVTIENATYSVNAPLSDDIILDIISNDLYSYLPGMWDNSNSLEIATHDFHQETGESMVNLTFEVFKEPSPLGFRANGNFFTSFVYDSEIGKWRSSYLLSYQLEEQELLGFDGYWRDFIARERNYKLENCDEFKTIEPGKYVITEQSQTEDGGCKVGEDSTIEDLDVLQGTFRLSNPNWGIDFEITSINWDENYMMMINGAGEYPYTHY